MHRSIADLGDDAFLKAGKRVLYTVERDREYNNFRIKTCTGFQVPQSCAGSAQFQGSRRLKHESQLGLNQHQFSKHATSSDGARARRRARRHLKADVDAFDL